MKIDTYFGFFAQAFFAAVAGALGGEAKQGLRVEDFAVTGTNALKLRWSQVDMVLVPELTEPGAVPFIVALTPQDREGLQRALPGRSSLQTVLEQVLACAIEPFNFVAKQRSKLSGVRISQNVMGFTAFNLEGELAYTMASARLIPPKGVPFGIRLLVGPKGRDQIEERTAQEHTQRALYAIIQGAYTCRPQWEPPPPPPGLEHGTDLSDMLLNAWANTFFCRNDGTLANRLFQRPVVLQTEMVPAEQLANAASESSTDDAKAGVTAPGVTVARLVLNGQKALEAFVLVPPAAEATLQTLSKTGRENFLGELFRVLFSDAGSMWASATGGPVQWKLAALRKVPADAIEAVQVRLKDDGQAARQVARMDEGMVSWYLALPPHTWQFLLRLTGKAMGQPTEGKIDRRALFALTHWDTGVPPWAALIARQDDRGLQELVRAMTQAKLDEQGYRAVSDTLGKQPGAQDRWMAALPASLRDRVERSKLEPGEAPPLLKALTPQLIALHRAGRVPEGAIRQWLTLYSEFLFSQRQQVLDRVLTLRHFIYGMDRNSLGRLLFESKDDLLVTLISGSEFPVVDQMRRAISPGYALRLLEDVAIRRAKVTAFAVQEAQLSLYRRAYEGMAEGRYMLRATIAKRLREAIRLLDES